MAREYLFIDSDEALKNWLANQQDLTAIAVDTEFMRFRTYFSKLCLIQLATDKEAICIDPLAITDFEPLLAMLTHPKIVKIFHSASQDLETLYTTFNLIPKPIFDTQIVETVLGADHLMSYQDTVEMRLNVLLEKTETRTDWEKRPLSQNQIDYAYDDVTYLYDLYLLMKGKIETKEEQRIFFDKTEALYMVEKYAPNPEMAWMKVKARKTLRGKRLQLLKVLAKRREEIAIEHNLPKRWVVDDAALINIAKDFNQPNNEKALVSYFEKQRMAPYFQPVIDEFLSNSN